MIGESQSFVIPAEDGVPLHIRKWGEAAKTCLLIHGFGDGAHVWDHFAPSLGRFYSTYAVDLRGHGDSGWDPSGRYAVEQHVSDMRHVLDAVARRSPVAVVGHSLGAEIGIRLAFAVPQRVACLGVVDYGPELNDSTVGQIQVALGENFRSYESTATFAATLARNLPLAQRELLSSFAEKSLRANTQGGFSLKCDPSLVKTDNRNDADLIWAMLLGIGCPIHLIRGAGSAVLPMSTLDKMAEVLKRAQFSLVAQSGHAVMIDNPVGFSAAIMPFLKRELIRDWQ